MEVLDVVLQVIATLRSASGDQTSWSPDALRSVACALLAPAHICAFPPVSACA